MKRQLASSRTPSFLIALLLLPPALGQGGGGAAVFDLIEATHGFDQLLPHRIEELDANGMGTGKILDVRKLADLRENLSATNGVLPAAGLPTAAVLPGGQPGNHFLSVRFSRSLDLDSVLDPTAAGQANYGLTGAITVTGIDPVSGLTIQVPGRAFVGGKTYAGQASGGMLELQSWVVRQGGVLAATSIDNDMNGVPDGLGFPGTVSGTSFPGDLDLVDRGALVFVADTDGDLATYETFPAGYVLQVRASGAVLDADGNALARPPFAATQVGMDFLPPEIAFDPVTLAPEFTPGNGDLDVDPQTDVSVRFTESVQPLSVGVFDGSPPNLSATLELGFGGPAFDNAMPFTAQPENAFDLSTWRLTPAFAFPGTGSVDGAVTNQVDEELRAGGLLDLAGNTNGLATSSVFFTGPGAGIVNAPVAPDAIYLGTRGAEPGISVLDLNGFGAATGNPRYDPTGQKGNHLDTNYPDNPNVKFQGSTLQLQPGTTTLDGGSAGVFTLTRDSNLETNLVRGGVVMSVGDLALGQALDVVYNNAAFPFGCQAGGGEICTVDGLKYFDWVAGGPNTIQPAPTFGSGAIVGAPNVISWAPHPNPPPFADAPLCSSPFLPGREPLSVDLTASNLLVPGDAFGDPSIGLPPSGLLAKEQNSWFTGPSFPQSDISNCQPYMIRQQVGHFLYVLDEHRGEIVVLNSNRMVVVDRIAVPSPTRMAMGTGLDLLAVTQARLDQVTFLDVDPSSDTFHTVVKTTQVGDAPIGIAWHPANEDILVCNQGDGSLSVLSCFSLEVRKVVTNLLTQPVDVAITPRQNAFGYDRQVYFAYVIQRDGSVAIFESGPNGVNGWGYDDVIGLAPYEFKNPKAIQALPSDPRGAVVIAHEGPIDLQSGQAGAFGEGAVSILRIESSVNGPQPLDPNELDDPQFRNMTLVVTDSVGEKVLSGIPVDLAHDDLRNLGALPNVHSAFSAGAPAPVNGKGLVRQYGGLRRGASTPDFLLVAVPGAGGGGVVDALRLDTASLERQDVNPFEAGKQSVPARRVRVLMNYLRQ